MEEHDQQLKAVLRNIRWSSLWPVELFWTHNQCKWRETRHAPELHQILGLISYLGQFLGPVLPHCTLSERRVSADGANSKNKQRERTMLSLAPALAYFDTNYHTVLSADEGGGTRR